MNARSGPPAVPVGFLRGHLAEAGFVAASIIWAAVLIDTGEIAWPLAVWIGTALVPIALHRCKVRDGDASTGWPHWRARGNA